MAGLLKSFGKLISSYRKSFLITEIINRGKIGCQPVNGHFYNFPLADLTFYNQNNYIQDFDVWRFRTNERTNSLIWLKNSLSLNND